MQEKIIKYLKRNLSKEQYHLFLEQEEKGEVSDEMIAEVMKAKKDAELRAEWDKRLEVIGADSGGETIPLPSLKPSYPKYAIAAAASLLLFLIAYFLIPSSSNPQTLAAQYWKYSTDPAQLISNPPQLKGGQGKVVTEGEADRHLQKAKKSYEDREYKSVSNALELIPPESQYYSEALILSGVAYFKLKENKKAINQFKKILNNRDVSGNDEARKFLSLIYLQTNQLEEAKKTLKEIIKAKDAFEEEAKKLLERLE